jgi:hypothetical protein
MVKHDSRNHPEYVVYLCNHHPEIVERSPRTSWRSTRNKITEPTVNAVASSVKMPPDTCQGGRHANDDMQYRMGAPLSSEARAPPVFGRTVAAFCRS